MLSLASGVLHFILEFAELSFARAMAVVHFLVSQGIPPQRLAAAGFGEFQPLVEGESLEALRENRRIELKLDQR